eukprot:358064-Chlamydomonas_euryale.AAC.1
MAGWHVNGNMPASHVSRHGLRVKNLDPQTCQAKNWTQRPAQPRALLHTHVYIDLPAPSCVHAYVLQTSAADGEHWEGANGGSAAAYEGQSNAEGYQASSH